MKLLLDTNIVVDYLSGRNFNEKETRMLMVLGRLGEFSLWISSSQITDLIYILSDGGKPALMQDVLRRLRGFCSYVKIYAPDYSLVHLVLSTSWADPDDAMIYEIAKVIEADAIISRNAKDFEEAGIRVYNSAEFFAWAKDEFGLAYDELAW